MAFSYEEAQRKIGDVENLENMLAFLITVKGVYDVPKGKTINDYTKEELKALPRRFVNSSEALKLMGVKVEKSK